jgi:hypothetical protein
MQNEHRAYKKAFKIEEVRLVQTSGKSITLASLFRDSTKADQQQSLNHEQEVLCWSHSTMQEESLLLPR